MTTLKTSGPARPRGFTLTEILVAIGIIVILVAITLPVVSKVRRAAQRADVQQQLNTIGAAIERYHADFRGYPGPLSNDQIAQTDPDLMAPGGDELFREDGTTALPDRDKITMAENLVLGLMGGLRRFPPTGPGAGTRGALAYDYRLVGQGPGQLNPRQPKKYSAYAEPINLTWNDSQPSSGNVNEVPGIASGYFVDDASMIRASQRFDSPIPEIVDRFTNPMPILYLRARPAAQGVISDDAVTGPGVKYQYDLNQILGYTTGQANGQTIGVGKDISIGEYIGDHDPKPSKSFLTHGLSSVEQGKNSSLQKGAQGYKYPYDSLAYLSDPSIRPTDPALINATGTPRKKNGYMLISAGPDRVYGTVDDITSFGDVAP